MTAREEPLQRGLAGEHAAVYAYGVAGARLDGAARERALRGYDRHRDRRDELEARLRRAGVEPVAAEASYALPVPVRSAEDAVLLLTTVEERLAAVWVDVVAAAGRRRDRATLALATGALQDAAVQAVRWRGGSVPFPGLPERAG